MANEDEGLSVEGVDDSLSEFQRRFAQLPDVEEPPQTFLQLLGQESEETDWNTILSYFLDPTEPHGFGTDLLETFLSSLEPNPKLNFDFDRLDSENINVRPEWVMRDLGVRPDITIYSERRWFVIIEMKVGASEHNDQTLDYVRSKKIGNIDKSEFGKKTEENEQKVEEHETGKNDSHNYIYLAPKSAASAKAPAFANIPWRKTAEELERFEHQSYGRYPSRSHTQLDDFLDTIRRELYMTDEKIEQDEIDKMQLYFEYADTFNEAENALDSVQERERKNWKERFPSDFMPSSWDSEKWRCRGDFAHIYRKEWQLTENGEQTDSGGAPYRISFTHNISDDPFRQGFLTFQLYCPRGADDDFTDEFKKRFHNDETIRDFFRSRDLTHNDGQKMWMTEAEYQFEQEELPYSYYEALRDAFEDHQEIADDITRVFSNAVDEVIDENQ